MNSNVKNKPISLPESLRRNTERAWRLANLMKTQTVMSTQELERTNTRIQPRDTYSAAAHTALRRMSSVAGLIVVRCTHYRNKRKITYPPYTALMARAGEFVILARAE